MLRKYLLIFVTLIISLSCKREADTYIFSTFREPATDGLYLAYSVDGFNWTDLGGSWLKPQVGTTPVMRDPSVIRGRDGTYHMVWTSSWKDDQGFGYASSEDLINWPEQRWIPVMQHESTTANVWAPEIFYDDDQDRYIIIWASTIPFRFEKGQEEEYSNHRMYYTTTKDFVDFSPALLFLDPGFSVIDAVIVKRATNDYVLVLKDNTRPFRNLRVAFGESPLGPFTNISEPFTRMYTEGPTVIKQDNEWIIYYEAYREKVFGAVKTSDFKTFEDITGEIKLPSGHKHGTIFISDKRTLRDLKKAAENNFSGAVQTAK